MNKQQHSYGMVKFVQTLNFLSLVVKFQHYFLSEPLHFLLFIDHLLINQFYFISHT